MQNLAVCFINYILCNTNGIIIFESISKNEARKIRFEKAERLFQSVPIGYCFTFLFIGRSIGKQDYFLQKSVYRESIFPRTGRTFLSLKTTSLLRVEFPSPFKNQRQRNREYTCGLTVFAIKSFRARVSILSEDR